jgi:hypothetical protein
MRDLCGSSTALPAELADGHQEIESNHHRDEREVGPRGFAQQAAVPVHVTHEGKPWARCLSVLKAPAQRRLALGFLPRARWRARLPSRPRRSPRPSRCVQPLRARSSHRRARARRAHAQTGPGLSPGGSLLPPRSGRQASALLVRAAYNTDTREKTRFTRGRVGRSLALQQRN